MKNLKRNLIVLSLILSINILPGNIFGQSATTSLEDSGITKINNPDKQSLFEAWLGEGQLGLKIETDLTHLINTKNEDQYQPAKLSIDKGDGIVQSMDIEVKARGKFRRKTCDFPPLKINFDKKDLKQTGLDGAFDKFKLVTHCTESEEDEQNLLKEYLAYKLYNQLTPKSYQVKLVKVTYVDTSSNATPVERFAFMIESTKELAARLGGEEIEGYNFNMDTLNIIDRQAFSMFQYMIGNTDWKTVIMHNIKIIKPHEGGKLIMIPYDFDFSGLVNAAYARPNSDLGQTNIRDRIYMDKVRDLKDLGKVMHYFKIHKKALLSIVDDFDGLSKKNRRDVRQFLESFFDTLENPDLANDAFVNRTL